MKIDLYTLSWNEEKMLGFFFQHYDPWIDRYFIYDDGSTDATLRMLAEHPRVVVRRQTRSHKDSFSASSQSLQNSFWKQSRGSADLVVVTAIDEHLFHPQMPAYLRAGCLSGVTAFPALGYQMITDAFPERHEHLATSHTLGATYDVMSKLGIFDPNAIEETNYATGRHQAAPTGRVVYPARDEVLNLHYKHLGLDYVFARQRFLAGGLGAIDRSQVWGRQYDKENKILVSRNDHKRRLADVSNPALNAHDDHLWPRWWRPGADPTRLVKARAAVRNDPDSFNLRRQHGLVLLENGDPNGAVDALLAAHDLAPELSFMLPELVKLLLELNRAETAVRVAERIAEHSPELALPLTQLGNIYFQSKRYGEAIAAHRAAIALDARSVASFAGLGRTLYETGDPDAAIEAMEHAIALEPKSPEHLRGLGTILLKEQKYLGAIEVFERAVAIDADHPQSLMNLAAACAGENRFEDAARSARAAVALTPDNAVNHHRLGLFLSRAGNLEHALASATRATSLDPDNVSYLVAQGRCLMLLERWKEALTIANHAIGIAPDHRGARNLHGSLIAST